MIILFIRSDVLQLKPKMVILAPIKKLPFPKARSKSVSAVQTQKHPEDDNPRDISLFYVRLVLLYRNIIQYIRTKMKRLACNGMAGYSTIYPNPKKRTTRKVRIVPLWWTETIQIQTLFSDFRKNGSALSLICPKNYKRAYSSSISS